MTATLTPLDTPLFDPDVIEEMEEHWGDQVACSVPDCDRPAVWNVKARCCTQAGQLCDAHEANLSINVASICARRHGIDCALCGHFYPAAVCLADIAIVREL